MSQIIIGNTSNKQHAYTVMPSTLSHTLIGGINRILFVLVREREAVTISGVTFNGVSMTKLLEEKASGGDHTLALFYMLDAQLPAAGGAYNIIYTNSGPRASGQLFAHCFGNVEQAVPFVSTDGQSETSNTSHALTLNGLRNGDGILFASAVNRGAANTWSPAADYTEWFDGANDGSGGEPLASSSTGIRRIVTKSGNYTPSSTSSGNGIILSAAVGFHPSEEVLGGPLMW